MRHRTLLALGLLSLAAVSCKRLATGAREEFARKHSCPEERVEVRPRDDVKWSKIILGDGSKDAPPDEVKKDPARLAKWKQDRESEHASARESLDALDVFQGTGCGHHELMACYHPGAPGGEGISTDRVVCNFAPAKASR